MWCDIWTSPTVTVLRFAIHTPYMVRMWINLCCSPHFYFDPRAFRHDWLGVQIFLSCKGFNPRTHVGATVGHSAHICSLRISIHAPMLDATSHIPFVRFDLFISIHVPVRGAIFTWFQSRTCVVRYILSSLTNGCNISIHAPLLGATSWLWNKSAKI